MKSFSLVYGKTKVFASLIQPKLVSVKAQRNNDLIVSKNLYDEKLYKTNNLEGAVNYYIETYLKDKLKGEK